MPFVRNASGKVHEVPVGHWALTSSDFTVLQPEPVVEPGLDALTVRELKALADERGVNLDGVTLKADIVRALS